MPDNFVQVTFVQVRETTVAGDVFNVAMVRTSVLPSAPDGIVALVVVNVEDC